MSKVFVISERYTEISGPVRDDFVTDLVRFRDSTSGELVLDFNNVESLSSIALAAVGKLHTWMEEHNRKLVIRGLSPNLMRLFTITGLATMLNIEDSAAGEV